MALSAKQRRFIDEYLIDFNATQAAIRAGYSERTAANIGWENVRKPEIAEAVKRRLQEAAMSADEALMRMAQIARGGYSAYLSPDGKVNLGQLLADGHGYLIKGTKFNAQGDLIVEFHDSKAALDTILKAHGAFDSKRGTEDDPIYMVQLSADDLAAARKQAARFEEELLHDDA